MEVPSIVVGDPATMRYRMFAPEGNRRSNQERLVIIHAHPGKGVQGQQIIEGILGRASARAPYLQIEMPKEVRFVRFVNLIQPPARQRLTAM